MVTISLKLQEIMWICEAVFEFGMAKESVIFGIGSIDILRKLKKHFRERHKKQMISDMISKMQLKHKLMITTYDKGGK